MAIDPQRFDGRLDAALSYALTLPPEEAARRFELIWEAGAWRADPTRWLQRIGMMRGEGRWSVEDVGERTLRTLEALGWESAKPHLYNAFLQWGEAKREHGAALAARVARWVTADGHADAGDADLVLRGAESFIENFAGAAPQLIDWILEHAISTLRSAHRLSLLRKLFLELTKLGRNDDAALLLTLMVSLDRGLKDWPNFLPLWRVVEDSQLGDELVCDLVLGLLRIEHSHLAFQPLRELDTHPRTATLVFAMLAAGDIPARFLEAGWEVAFEHVVPPDLPGLTSIESLDAALRRLTWFKGDRTPWARVFAAAYWDLWRDPTDEHDALAVPAVRRLAGWRDDVAAGVAQALAPRLSQRTDDAAALARDILAEGPPTVQRVVAAMDCFAPTTARSPQRSAPARPTDGDVERLRAQLLRFVTTPWRGTIYGLDVGALLKQIVHLELTQLPDGDKVQLDGATLRVDRAYLDLLLTSPMSADARLQGAYLYVAHELVHLPQGLGAIKTVRRLRAAGGESSLLHLDLVADHIAALMVHTAVPRWSVVELKAAILGSLTNFPTGPFATEASRLRKSTRYVSERLDLLMRQRTSAAPDHDIGYWFVDFGPLGGPAFVLRSGPPMHLVGDPVELSKADTDHLLHAADGSDAAALADRVVVRIVEAMPR